MIIKKQLKRDREAREKLLEGINVVGDAVGSTLGPRSRTVALDQFIGVDVAPVILRDGVSVARAINLEDTYADMGARLIKSASVKTVNDVGDGTTLTTILTQAIVNEAYKAISGGLNAMKIKSEIEQAATKILAELKTRVLEVSGDRVAQVAAISASDPVLGSLVAEAMNKVGKEGLITVEEGKSLETVIEYKQGMEIDRGYYSPYFVNDQKRAEAIIEEPYILLTDKRISTIHELVPFLQKLHEQGIKNLVIFAGELVEEALQTLVVNKLKGVFNVVGIQAPAFGGRRVDELHDIAALVGGHPILEDEGRDLSSVTIEELGRAEKVISDRDKTIILGGQGKNLKARIEELKEQIKIPNTEFDKDIKEQRLANLTGSVAVINVGGATEVEVKEKKERVIDAVAATKAAVEEGIVAGGEITFLTLALEASKKPEEALNVGERILISALKAPFRRLIENSGMDYAEALLSLSGKKYPHGIDVTDGEVKDMIKVGIIDPVKVLRCALQNSVSVAGNCLTTNTLIVTVEKE